MSDPGDESASDPGGNCFKRFLRFQSESIRSRRASPIHLRLAVAGLRLIPSLRNVYAQHSVRVDKDGKGKVQDA